MFSNESDEVSDKELIEFKKKVWIYDNTIRPIREQDSLLILKILNKIEQIRQKIPRINIQNTLFKLDNVCYVIGNVMDIVNIIIKEFIVIYKTNANHAFNYFIKKDIIPIVFYQNDRTQSENCYPDPQILFFNNPNDTSSNIDDLIIKDIRSPAIYFYPFAYKINQHTTAIQFTVSKTSVTDDNELCFEYIPNLSEVKKYFPKHLNILDQGNSSKKKILLIESDKFKNRCLVCYQIEEIFGINISIILPSNASLIEFDDCITESNNGIISVGYGPSPSPLPKAPILDKL